jgi:hypothetical protein
VKKEEIIFSLTDLIQSVKKRLSHLILFGTICALVSFLFVVSRPIHFTAHGIFKWQPPKTNLIKGFEMGEESYYPRDEPAAFINSIPVLENVVRKLHLQAVLIDQDKGNGSGKLKEIWYVMKSSWETFYSGKKLPPSPVLKCPTFKKIHVPDLPQSKLLCSEVQYDGETSLFLTIRFISAEIFQVFENEELKGEGALDVPFSWDDGMFVLSGEARKNAKITLYLLPVEPIVQSLQNTLHVFHDKKNRSLIHVSCMHRDRHLAARLVNEAMEAFQEYLQTEGKKKIAQQISYLYQRQEQTMEKLDEILEKQKQYFTLQLDSAEFLIHEKEMSFMAKTQAEFKHEILHVRDEIEALAQAKLPFPELMTQLCITRERHILEMISIQAAKNAIQEHQKTIDSLVLDCEKYDYCLSRLQAASFDPSSLAKILSDHAFETQFEHMHALHLKLIDKENWTLKEREHMHKELETSRMFLCQQIQILKEGALLHVNVLKERIESLQKDLLYMLFDKYNQLQSSLAALSEQASTLPQKWLAEQKIEMNIKIYTEMLETITKMIETKNAGYHFDYSAASCHKKALPPVRPDPSKLLLGTMTGFLIGIFLSLLLFILEQIWHGPSASGANLLSQGYSLLPEKERVPFLGIELEKRGRLVLMASKQTILFAPALVKWLAKKGENVFIIDLTSKIPSDFLKGKDKETYLASQDFKDFVDSCKKHYDRVLIFSQGGPQRFETLLLASCADTCVFGITDEKLSEIERLPEERTLFFIQERLLKKMLSIKEIAPTLEALLKRTSSFSLQDVLRVPSKRI